MRRILWTGTLAGIVGMFGGAALTLKAPITKRGDIFSVRNVPLVSFQDNDLIIVTRADPKGDERTWYDFRPFGTLDLYSSRSGTNNKSGLAREGDSAFDDQADYYRTHIFPKIPK